MSAEEYKEVALARILQARAAVVEQTQAVAMMPDDMLAARLQVPAERAAAILAQYREMSSDEFFERELARLRAMPAEDVKASHLAMLHKVSSEANTPPMPSE